MLFKISLRNIKKSVKDYAIYFFTLILGVAIFYVFNSIESQTAMMRLTSSSQDIINLMIDALSGVSVLVSFILGFLIIYASRFLIKRRNKEFGVYLTLGMSKRKISLILFFETLLIGIISLIVGLGLGIILSQFMSLLVANMFEADMTEFQFVFSFNACFKTMLYFGIMYLLVMVFNTISISKCKLIDLLYGSKKSEEVKLKNLAISMIVFFISAGMLGYAYYLVTAGIDQINSAQEILFPIGLGIVGTFLLFWSLSGILLRLFKKRKKMYFKGLNSFTLRQISSKINTTVFSMSIICLMLFVTICVLSSSLCIKNSMTANLKTLAPIDIELTKWFYTEDIEDYGYSQEQIEDSNLSIRESMKRLDFNVDEYFSDIVEFDEYTVDDVTIVTTLGSYYPEAAKKYPYLFYDSLEIFVKVSDYNQFAKLYHLDSISLDSDEYAIVADFDSWIEIRNKGLKTNPGITILDKTYYPKYEECKDGFINISSNHVNMGFIVVPDEALNESMRYRGVLLANYKETSDEGKASIEEKVLALNDHPYHKQTGLSGTTRLEIYESSIGLGAMVTFIGLYLGIVFLVSSAAILALKELSESNDNKERFHMLRKIGADEKMIHKALFRQIGIFFLFPVIVAVIHSVFGIIFCNYILETFGKGQLLPSIIMTAVFLCFIYGGYFIITYLCSKNIIKEHY